MKSCFLKLTMGCLSVLVLFSCANEQAGDGSSSGESALSPKTAERKLIEESITYAADDVVFHGYVSFDQNQQGKRPAVLVVHEWWGVNDYIRNRVKQLG